MRRQAVMLLALALYALLAPALAQAGPASRLVQTAQGPVRGYHEDGIFIFYSIPYATAPTGPHKFKAPTPPPMWLEPFEAVNSYVICPQGPVPMLEFETLKRQEDCLIANIFVPDTHETNLPVMVMVHGGAFQMGYGNMMKPLSLVKSKKIIAVTFNYRLGTHGFLCLGTKDAPGNAGMKDQVALLRWVKKNIASFGGNPDDVTIGGYSAGASAVDLLQLSKTTKGLFNKVIPESGANVGVWSVQLDPLQNAKDFARQLNFTDVDDTYALENFYKNAPLELLMYDPFFPRKDSTFGFSPCVERDTEVERFLEDTPVNILKEGNYVKLPMLYGFAKMEGILRLSFGAFEMWKYEINEKFSDFLPADLQFGSEDEQEKVAKDIKEFYFGDTTISEETILSYIDYFTDVFFAYPTLRSLKLQVKAGNDKVYLYEYSFVDDLVSSLDPKAITFGVKGAGHCAQTNALYEGFGYADESKLSERTRSMRAKMRELWHNFITTGAPVPPGSEYPPWPAVGADGAPHMSLDERLELRGPLLARRARFWDAVYAEYYRQPVPPPPPTTKHASYNNTFQLQLQLAAVVVAVAVTVYCNK